MGQHGQAETRTGDPLVLSQFRVVESAAATHSLRAKIRSNSASPDDRDADGRPLDPLTVQRNEQSRPRDPDRSGTHLVEKTLRLCLALGVQLVALDFGLCCWAPQRVRFENYVVASQWSETIINSEHRWKSLLGGSAGKLE